MSSDIIASMKRFGSCKLDGKTRLPFHVSGHKGKVGTKSGTCGQQDPHIGWPGAGKTMGVPQNLVNRTGEVQHLLQAAMVLFETF